MIVVADTGTDVLAEAALVLMTDAESTIAREAVADPGLVNPSFIFHFLPTQKKKIGTEINFFHLAFSLQENLNLLHFF